MSRKDDVWSAWGLNDNESPITDASEANNYVTEDMILRFQKVSKEVTDVLVALSSADAGGNDTLHKYREAVILAYSSACNGDLREVKRILEKVLNS